MTHDELFKTAVQKAKSGDHDQARSLLLSLVEANPQYELAWLWLSELVAEPEDKIIALENALTINPQRPQTKTRLAQLRQKYPQFQKPPADNFSINGRFLPDQSVLATDEEIRWAKIRELFAEQQVANGRQELAAFLRRYTHHEEAWWLMVQHADSQKNLLTALDHLLRLNGSHPEAPNYIAKIQPTDEEFLPMARLYERMEEWETAVRYYKRTLKSPINADRLLAKKRLPHAEAQVKLGKIKYTSPTATVLRLASGPMLLYAMLVLVQAGLNPLHASPFLCLGNLAFGAGLLLYSGLAHTPDHPWIEKLGETAVFQNRQRIRLFSLALILLPILLLLINTIARLLAFDLGPIDL
ncbi:MAG: hypothetical protein H6654_18435 [Ardenticatenaceae bacterium]|nr:hypothetical protein [Anaerolineales bacterium]MCB8937476.1 hypothetical protein [Ardenticatenaceae bacterium]MCB8975543.1 hypothetical protein [Ardenticatenaceae bacterium]